MEQYDTVSQNIDKHPVSSLRVLLQQLTLCETLLRAMLDSALCFNADLAAWVGQNLIPNAHGTEQSHQHSDLHEESHCCHEKQLQHFKDSSPGRTASVLLQSVLADVMCVTKCLTSKIEAIAATEAEPNLKR